MLQRVNLDNIKNRTEVILLVIYSNKYCYSFKK
nr:MAG TPA: hypothetical protein [Caudoviricetes sp.]